MLPEKKYETNKFMIYLAVLVFASLSVPPPSNSTTSKKSNTFVVVCAFRTSRVAVTEKAMFPYVGKVNFTGTGGSQKTFKVGGCKFIVNFLSSWRSREVAVRIFFEKIAFLFLSFTDNFPKTYFFLRDREGVKLKYSFESFRRE